MKILITGGAGRLGTTIAKKFISEGFAIRILDLDNPRNRKAIQAIENTIEIFWGDITDAAVVQSALEGIDAVIHMAAVLPPVADQKPELARSVNVEGTRLLVSQIIETGRHIPLVYTSSVAVHGPTPEATLPISAENHFCKPAGGYALTKYEAENIIQNSGIDYIILRLSVNMYFNFEIGDLRRMFSVPLRNRIEFCHPENTAIAIVNSVNKFERVKNNVFIISGGPGERMLYKDMISAILKVLGLPVPPDYKFTRKPYYLDWYETSRSEAMLKYRVKTFTNYIQDYIRELTRRFTPLFIPFMRYFVSPLFGWMVVRMI